MTAFETAVRVVVDLLVAREYETAVALDRGDRFTAQELKEAIAEYGETLITPPPEWWDTVEVTGVDGKSPPRWHVAAPLWTVEDGESDLTIEMHIEEFSAGLYHCFLLDVHML